MECQGPIVGTLLKMTKLPETKLSKIVNDQVTAYNAKDLELFLSFYHQEIEIYIEAEEVPKIIGIEDFRIHYRNFFNTNPNVKAEIIFEVIEDSIIYQHEKLSGRSDGSLESTYAVKYQILGEKIKSVRFKRLVD